MSAPTADLGLDPIAIAIVAAGLEALIGGRGEAALVDPTVAERVPVVRFVGRWQINGSGIGPRPISPMCCSKRLPRGQ